MSQYSEKIAAKKESSSKRNSSFTLFLLLLTWAFLAVISGYFYHISEGKPLSLIRQMAQSGDVMIDIAAMNERILTLEQQVDMLESYSYSSQSSSVNTGNEEQDAASSQMVIENKSLSEVELHANAQQEEKLEQSPSSTAQETGAHEALNFLNETIAKLKADVAQQQKQTTEAEEISQGQMLLLSAYELEKAVLSHGNYTQALYEFKYNAPETEQFDFSIEYLMHSADEGLMRPELLEESFENALQQAVVVIRQKKQNPTLIDQLAAKFPSLISVRKTASTEEENVAGDADLESRLAYIERQVTEYAWKNAYEQFDMLDAPAVMPYFEKWLSDVERYIGTVEHVQRLVALSREQLEH